MNYTKPQEINDAFKGADNPTLWSLSKLIANHIKALDKTIRGLKEELSMAQEVALGQEETLTDSELRGKLRALLVAKVAEGSISAAEIAQLKDVFGLTNAKQDITIELVHYKSLDEVIEM